MSKQITREEFLRIYFDEIIGEQEAKDGSKYKVTDWPLPEIALETVNDLLPTVLRVLQGGRTGEIALNSLEKEFRGKTEASREELLQAATGAVLWGWKTMAPEGRRYFGEETPNLINSIREKFGQQEESGIRREKDM